MMFIATELAQGYEPGYLLEVSCLDVLRGDMSLGHVSSGVFTV